MPRTRWIQDRVAPTVITSTALALVGALALAPGEAQERRTPPSKTQAPLAPPDGDAAKTKGGLRIRPGAPPKNARGGNAVDPLQPPAGAEAKAAAPVMPVWPYHYRLQLPAAVPAGTPAPRAGAAVPTMTVRYFPSKQGASAPVVVLIHDLTTGRSGKDFEEPVESLKNLGLAQHLQDQGYAVVVPDLPRMGRAAPVVVPEAEPKKKGAAAKKDEPAPEPAKDAQARGPSAAAWQAQALNLQALYQFLVDRHNRREVNLSKLAVVGVGDAANLVAGWAATPGAATSVEGRAADVGAMVLVSPRPEIAGLRLANSLAPLLGRMPVLLLGGKNDPATAELLEAARPIVQRSRFSKVELLDARQQGYTLLRFAPGAAEALTKFLDTTVKVRIDEWEPRYNLNPVSFAGVTVVNRNAAAGGAADAAKGAAEPAKKAEAEPAKKADAPGS